MTDGLEALSVRQVANRLGVWPTTVMHHAGGRREGLVTLLIEHLAAGIGTDLLRLADAILDALEDAGLDPDVAPDAYDVFLTYVLGSAGRQTTASAPARWRGFEIALEHAEPDAYPALRRATLSDTARDDDARFAGGLDLVLDAIAARAER
jgi:AcrR family transcriptional regulator